MKIIYKIFYKNKVFIKKNIKHKKLKYFKLIVRILKYENIENLLIINSFNNYIYVS